MPAVDLNTCCDQNCDQYDVATCPTTRTSNPCKVFKGNCVTPCPEYTSTAACPITLAAGGYDRCFWGGSCKERADCTAAFDCAAGSILREVLKEPCDGNPCLQTECCENQEPCTELGCGATGVQKEAAAALLCKRGKCVLADDEATCCDPKCETFDSDDCPARPTSNPCSVVEGNCQKACAAFRTDAECPKLRPDGTKDRCFWKAGTGCTERERCTDAFTCTGGKVVKSALIGFCEGHCTQLDCCGMPGICTASDCAPLWYLKMAPPAACLKTECTNEECCFDPMAMFG